MKKLEDHIVVLYLVVTFLFTWIFWGIEFTLLPNGIFRIIGSFMPSIVAIIFTGYCCGVNGVKKLLKKLAVWRVNPLNYAFIFLYTVITIIVSVCICNIIGQHFEIMINDHISTFKLDTPLNIVFCFFMVMIFGGPVGEELGWRGFLLPKLQEKFHPLISGILLGVVWSMWHIPMFYFHVQGYEISFISYLLETIYLSILFTWLYNNTKGSLLLIILFHTIDNFIMSICINNFMMDSTIYTSVSWIVRLIILCRIIFYMFRNPVKETE